jgi:threonine dehydrogenase-like Zn-dependent dehydrogenase
MMRAAVLQGDSRAVLRHCDLPIAAAGQVRVRVEGSGVCASNLPVWEGRPWFAYPQAPGAPGHEGWGVVDALGTDVAETWLGRRVTFLSGNAYAEWDVADATQLVPLPAPLDGVPCPGEPLACAINVLKRAAVTAGEWLIVVGVGFLGAAIVRLGARAGARVIALSRRPYALDVARRLGATHTLPLTAAVVNEVSRLTEGMLADCVIECVGAQGTLDLAAELTRTRGRLVIAGYHQDGLRQVNLQLWNWRGLDVINAHERDPAVYLRGMRRAVEATVDGTIDADPLLTHEFPLERLGEALQMTHDRPDGFMKAVIRS